MIEEMNETIKINDSEVVRVIEKMDIKSVCETWTEIELVNGVKIRIKPVIISVAATDKIDEFGRIVYAVKSQNIADTIYPKEDK